MLRILKKETKLHMRSCFRVGRFTIAVFPSYQATQQKKHPWYADSDMCKVPATY